MKKRIISSLLELDFYKLTMLQTFFHQMKDNTADYQFINRDPSVDLSIIYDELEDELDYLCTLRFTPEEIGYLRTLGTFKEDFLSYLSEFKLDRNLIEVNGNLPKTKVALQTNVTLFEIYTLAIVSELYFRKTYPELDLSLAREKLSEKIKLIKETTFNKKTPFEIFDFGLRRRFSGAWQEEVVTTLNREIPEYFKGTSNVYLAMKLGITPIGTMAHEYLQSFQQMPGVALDHFQKAAFETWLKEYDGKLGIALTDVITTDAFISDFSKELAERYDGGRHDSACPVEWGNKMLGMYSRYGIESLTKKLVFSDSLNVPKSIGLYNQFADDIKTGFGVGTNFTNDVGVKPLNITMKLITCNGGPTAKISDAPGKTASKDTDHINKLNEIYKFKLAA